MKKLIEKINKFESIILDHVEKIGNSYAIAKDFYSTKSHIQFFTFKHRLNWSIRLVLQDPDNYDFFVIPDDFDDVDQDHYLYNDFNFPYQTMDLDMVRFFNEEVPDFIRDFNKYLKENNFETLKYEWS